MSAYDTYKSAILGHPYDQNKKPSKSLAIQAFAELQAQVEGAQAGAIVQDSLSALNALSSVYAENIMAWVVNDATNSNNGIYENTGTTSSPIWTRRSDIPQFIISCSNVGGTANAITADTDLPIPTQDGRCLIMVPIIADNTGSTTVRFNGGSVLTVKTIFGDNIPANALKNGMVALGYISGSEFRLTLDHVSFTEFSNLANDNFQNMKKLLNVTFLHNLKSANELAIYSANAENLWQDLSRNTPVTAVGDPVAVIDDVSGRENHLQFNAGAGFGVYRKDGKGAEYVEVSSAAWAIADPSSFPRPRTLRAPAYVGAALDNLRDQAAKVVGFGVSNAASLHIGSQNNLIGFTCGISSSAGNASIKGRAGSNTPGHPFVVDGYWTDDEFTSYIEGGGQTVLDEFAGGYRNLAHSIPVGTEIPECSFGIGSHGAGSSLGEVNFYGAVFVQGEVPPETRREINKWLQSLTKVERGREYDMFLAAGQSNMLGQGDETTSPDVGGKGLQYIDSGATRPALDPIHHSRGGGSTDGSLIPAFVNEWYAQTRRKSLVVGYAVSGSALTTGIRGGWKPASEGGQLFDEAVEIVRNAKAHVPREGGMAVFRGVLWLAGEQDAAWAGVNTVSAYEAKIVDLRDRFWAAFPEDKPPLLLISVDRRTDGANDPGYVNIRQAMVDAAANNDGIHLVMPYQDFVGQGQLADVVHWNQTALNTAGQLAGQNAATALGLDIS